MRAGLRAKWASLAAFFTDTEPAGRNPQNSGLVLIWACSHPSKREQASKREQENAQMDKNRIEGKFDKAKGDVKDATGKVLGNDRLRAEGQADKLKGEIKDAAGKAADAARRGIDKTSDIISNASKH
jgi:uncharacterized protein YjbJ (UPF0337 family)